MKQSKTLKHKEIGKCLQIIWRIKPFMNKYNWKGINDLSRKHALERFVKNNPAIARNVLYFKNEYMHPPTLQNNSNYEKQIIILIIPNADRLKQLAVKKLSAILQGITSEHDGDFWSSIAWNKKQTWGTPKVRENKDFCGIKILVEL